MNRTRSIRPNDLAPGIRLGVLAAACLATCTAALLAMPAQAQDADGGVDAEGPPPRLWIEPRISAGATLSSNGNLSGNGRSELTLELSPGVRVVANTPRVQGFIDYSLTGLTYLQDTSRSNLRNALSAAATVEAWDNRAFVDLGATITGDSISVLGVQRGDSLSDANRSETRSLSVSPYWRGPLAGDIDMELRYALSASDTDTGSRSDVTQQTASVSLARLPAGRLLGWTASLNSSQTDYSLTRDTRSDQAQVGLIVSPTAQLSVTLTAGRERNDIITLQEASYDNTGLAVEWRPSTRTRLAVSAQKRYFGTGHDISLEHRSGLTVWRYTDTRDANNTPLQAINASLGSVFDLFDALYTGIEPDPVRRAQLINAELQRLGLDPDTELLQSFLASSATLQRVQELSVALVGQRSTITFALGRSDQRRLSTVDLGNGDDFDSVDSIQQQSVSLRLAHRLTQRLSLNAELRRQNTQTGLAAVDNRINSVTVGLSARLAPRTTGSVRLRHAVSRGASNGYTDTAIGGLITHRF